MSISDRQLDLHRDLGLLLENVQDPEEQTEILRDVEVLTAKGKTVFASREELQQEFTDPTCKALLENVLPERFKSWLLTNPLLKRADDFFDSKSGVKRVFTDFSDGDVLYEMHNSGQLSTYIYFDYEKKDAGLVASADPSAGYVQSSLKLTEDLWLKSVVKFSSPDEAKGSAWLKKFPEFNARQKLKQSFNDDEADIILNAITPIKFNQMEKTSQTIFDLFLDFQKRRPGLSVEAAKSEFLFGVQAFPNLNLKEFMEALTWYTSPDFDWIDQNPKNTNPELSRMDKISLIKESFDQDLVNDTEKDFKLFFKDRERSVTWIRGLVLQHIDDALQDKSDPKRQAIYKAVVACCGKRKLADMIMMVVLIESKGDYTKKNGKHYGLMQVNKTIFPKNFTEAQMYDPPTNIAYGTDYFVTTCLNGDVRNPEKNFTLGFINYSAGPGAAGDIRQGETPENKETYRYVMDKQSYEYLRDIIIYERLKAKSYPKNLIFPRPQK